MSTRQLLRIARRLERYPADSIAESIRRTCLAAFLPPLARTSLEQLLVAHTAAASAAPGGASVEPPAPLTVSVSEPDAAQRKTLTIGDVSLPIRTKEESNELLVPNVR